MVHKKLMQARIRLQGTKLEKSGLNKFANYKYFELGDFLPEIQNIFNDLGLCGVVSYDASYATLTITDTDDGTVIVISSPMAAAELKGAHPIQNLGAVETYQRRYLWMTALEIVEHDVIDSSDKKDEPKAKAEPKAEPKMPPKVMGGGGEWSIKVTAGADADSWLQVVGQSVDLMLSAVQSLEDVMSIYSNNKSIMDELKKLDDAKYKEVMTKFTAAKLKFKKEQ
jgi:hypothetical protein